MHLHEINLVLFPRISNNPLTNCILQKKTYDNLPNSLLEQHNLWISILETIFQMELFKKIVSWNEFCSIGNWVYYPEIHSVP